MNENLTRSSNIQEGRWISKYAQLNIKEMVLPDSIRDRILAFLEIKNGVYNVPNILLAGSPGCGKTTIAKAIANTLGVKPYFINASIDNGINLLRDDLAQYCNTPSVINKITKTLSKKVVILDEIDNTTTSFKEGFKSFVENYGKNVTFIMTCNDITSFTQPILSRFMGGYINFNEVYSNLAEDEFNNFKSKIVSYIEKIIKNEGITEDKWDREVIAEIVDDNFPDIRYSLNHVQAIYDERGDIKSYKKIKVDMNQLLKMNLRDLNSYLDKMSSYDYIVREIHKIILEMDDIKLYMVYSDSLVQYKSDFINRKAIVMNLINLLKLNKKS